MQRRFQICINKLHQYENVQQRYYFILIFFFDNKKKIMIIDISICMLLSHMNRNVFVGEVDHQFMVSQGPMMMIC